MTSKVVCVGFVGSFSMWQKCAAVAMIPGAIMKPVEFVPLTWFGATWDSPFRPYTHSRIQRQASANIFRPSFGRPTKARRAEDYAAPPSHSIPYSEILGLFE